MYDLGPINLDFNFSDAAAASYNGPQSQYLGLKYNQPLYSFPENQTGHYPTDLLWYDARGKAPGSSTPTSAYFDSAGLISLRSVWSNSNALFAGIKAGFDTDVTPYGSTHEDLEIGSFVFDALGVRWATDLGYDNYGLGGYFIPNPWTNPNRWQYYRTRAEGNNTLVINPSADGGQTSYGTATITNFKSSSSIQQAIIDMTAAYSQTDGNPSNKVSSTTPVTSDKRGMRFINGVAQIQDEVTASSGVDFNWFIHTQQTISISGNVATLTPASGTSRLQMTIQSPSGATFKTMAAKPLRTSPDYLTFTTDGETPNTGVNKLWIELPSTTSTRVTATLAPYIQGNTPPAPPAVTALNSW